MAWVTDAAKIRGRRPTRFVGSSAGGNIFSQSDPTYRLFEVDDGPTGKGGRNLAVRDVQMRSSWHCRFGASQVSLYQQTARQRLVDSHEIWFGQIRRNHPLSIAALTN